MLIKFRYVGSGETGLTVNNVYFVLSFNGMKAIILNDSGVPYQTVQSINETNHWELVSIDYTGCTELFHE